MLENMEYRPIIGQICTLSAPGVECAAMKPSLTDFDWTDLHIFLQAARKGPIAIAADQLRLDVTTVRRRLAALEEAIGIKLFVKSGRLLQLTAEGQRIYSIASQMEELSNEIARDATDAARELAGVVRVSTMEGFGSFYLAPRLSQFVNRHPQLSIQLVNSQHVLNLSEREADVSINMVNPQRGRLLVRKVGQFSVGLYGSASYLEAAGTPRTRRDLQDHTFITYVDELISVPNVRWLPDVIEKPRARFTCTSLVAQYNAACAGSGLVMLPHFMAGRSDALSRVMTTEINLIRDWWLVVHQDLQAVPRIRAVIDFISTVMRHDRDVLMS
jgi:DNA-binding transcriptional LysR family regulator